MPFKHGVWRDPTEQELDDQKSRIIERRLTPGLPVSDELQNSIRAAIDTTAQVSRVKALKTGNAQQYDNISLIAKHAGKQVDIIVPVYNAIHLVKHCLQSVQDRTEWPYHLTIVDDASDSFTSDELYRFAQKYRSNTTLITNVKNRGFAATVNRGMKAGIGDYIVLLNSDVLVTPRWLTKMVMAMEADPRHQIVNPATNNTAVINVPMSEGCSYLDMNKVFELYSERSYPEIMPTGFCFMFKRELSDKIGMMDEGFKNFGEETDWWMRVISNVTDGRFSAYKSVMADDTYVFHQRGASFASLGEEEQKKLRSMAGGRFRDLWPEFDQWKRTYDVNEYIGKLRQPVHATVKNALGPDDRRVCWVVHSTGMCGAMAYIADIVNEINERGGDARIVLIKRPNTQAVDTLAELRCTPYVFSNYKEFLKDFTTRVFDKGVVIAATAEIAQAVVALTHDKPNLKPLLHVQSYEPDMIPDKEVQNAMKESFRSIPGVMCSSKWINKELKKLGVKTFSCVLPGVDQSLFYPRGRSKGDERPTVMLPMIKSYTYKGYNRGVELMQELVRQARAVDIELRILVYGVKSVKEVPEAIGLGAVAQVNLARVLGTEVDVFVDPSHLHSYGLPALEALASGCDVVSWDNKGIREYAGKKHVLPADTPVREVAAKVIDSLAKKTTWAPPKPIMKKHDRIVAVGDFIADMEDHLGWVKTTYRIVVACNHMRKHGGPTTLISMANELAKRGHDVSLASIYPDLNPEVLRMTDLPLDILNFDNDRIPKCDLLITHSDCAMNQAFANTKRARKKIMLKLSHNPRFKDLETQGLKFKWDAVVTSSDWLREVCLKPTEGWDYKPVEASRIGWVHYGHDNFDHHPSKRNFPDVNNDVVSIGTLIHAHPSKGSSEALTVMDALRKKYHGNVRFVGVGEIDPRVLRTPLTGLNYKFAPSRSGMAGVFRNIDVWIGASHTEGLGRLALEAMSSSVACVLTDTGAEFVSHDQNALVVPVDNMKMMAKAVDRLVSDKSLRKRLASAGYATAAKLSDPTPMIDELEKVIEDVF